MPTRVRHLRARPRSTVPAVDVVIPTCARDRQQAELLFRSLDTYVPAECIGTVNLVCVDSPLYLATKPPWASLRHLDTLKFRRRTTVITLEDLGFSSPNAWQMGWVVQQLAKLLYARHAKTEFYLTLDSKNFALRPAVPTDFFRGTRAAATLEDVAIHLDWWQRAMRALRHPHFDLSPSRLALSAGTPVFLHTKTVCALLDWVEATYQQRFQRVLAELPPDARFTEFGLYFTYLDREGLFDRLHFESKTLHDIRSMMWDAQAEPQLRRRYSTLFPEKPRGLFSTIHAGVWNCLSDEARGRLLRRVSGGRRRR